MTIRPVGSLHEIEHVPSQEPLVHFPVGFPGRQTPSSIINTSWHHSNITTHLHSMGYFVGITSTGFVGTDELSAVTSFQPCHIFGDQMLIGTGIRVGFYLLYIAAIVAVLFGVDKQFRFWHGAWGILALSLFLSMFLNVVDYNLIIIDYAILIQLVLWYPVYFVFTVLFRQALVVDGRRGAKTDTEYRERLQRCRQSAVTELDVARARAYSDVLKAFALHAAAEEADADHDAAQEALVHAVQHYVSHWHEQIEVPAEDGSQLGNNTDGGAVTTVYNTELIEEIAAAPTRADIDKLRDLYVAALVHSNHSVAEARAAEHEVALIASEELVIKRRARRPKNAFRHFLLTTSYKDQLTAAIGLLIWSMYMFGTAALNWPLLRNGNKQGGTCDNVPTVYFVLAPKKPFADAGFATFLRVWTVGVCIVAVITTAVALFILFVSFFGPAALGLRQKERKRKGKKSVESGQGEYVYDVRSSPGYSCKARGRHTQEILSCIHQTQSRTIRHRYQSRTTSPIQFTLWNIPWAVLLAVLLLVTIVCAELTINRQGPNNNMPLDFARPPLRETSEILGFLIGLYSLVLTLLSVIGAFVAAILRKRRRGNQHDEQHIHYYRREKGGQAGRSEQPALVD
ncbi:hypothetical protein QC764_302120 [Podospora pseudoanserina]|uniref:Uncharacterized protein n=1 Tax=Podospora pseudoanserina TaxID=2609844 RepID=A0ABR0IBM2_9PEZI|nr:hypothetical protein QC764_302120 [Podospora pseudoanserina]